jgi:hypothetical protein
MPSTNPRRPADRRGTRSAGPPTRPVLAAAALIMLTHTGCGGSGTTPSSDVAKASLESALSAWMAGTPPGSIDASTPPIQAVDSVWRSGRKLDDFEIVGEAGNGSPREFVVQLTHGDPPARQEARYLVIGTGPIWIYRAEDYERVIKMDDNPSEKKPVRRR